jgi:hypothetical protein
MYAKKKETVRLPSKIQKLSPRGMKPPDKRNTPTGFISCRVFPVNQHPSICFNAGLDSGRGGRGFIVESTRD